MKTVIYLRISDEKQISGTSLETQESVCRSYYQRENYEIVDIVKDEAVSAKKTSTQRVVELLKFVEKNRKKFGVLLVYRLDRFARSQEQHHWLRKELLKRNIILRSATEKIGESGSEKLIEGVLAAVNEYDNDIRIERCRLGMIRRLEEGLWPWRVVAGYFRPKIQGQRLTVDKIDETSKADFISIFDMYAAGYTYKAIADRLNKKSVYQRDGKKYKFSKQSIEKIISNVFYIGLTHSALDNETRKGKHEPLIPVSLWEKCQRAKKNKSSKNKMRSKHNEHFPLRGFLIGPCGHNLTAAFSRGRHGGKYGYYFCLKRDCENYKITVMHTKFLNLLDEIEPPKELVDLYMEYFLEDIQESYEQKEQRRKTLELQLERIKEKKESLLDLRLENEIDSLMFKKRRGLYEKEVLSIKQEVQLLEQDRKNWKEIVKYGKSFVTNIRRRWEKLPIEGKVFYQGSIIREKLNWDGENYQTPRLLEIIEAINNFKDLNVTPRGIEPRFSG